MPDAAFPAPRAAPASPLPDDLGLVLPLRGIQLIEASAGTGKTFTVATIYARLVIAFGLPVSTLLAVTFTEAATKELREQLRERLVLARDLLDGDAPAAALVARAGDDAATALTRTLLRDALAHATIDTLRRRLRVAVEQMDLAPILTIHGFCQRALTEHALEAGQPLAPRELVLNEKALLREIAEDFWRRHSLARADADALLATWSSPGALADALPGLMSLDALEPAAPDAVALQAARERADVALSSARAALAAVFPRHAEAAFDALREACDRGWVNRAISRPTSVEPVFTALHLWTAAGGDGDPGIDGRKLARYGTRRLAAKTNKGGVTPASPLFDAIDAWADARDAAARVAHDAALALVHAARDDGIRRLAEVKQARGLLGFDDMIRGVADALAGPTGARFAARLRRQYRVALVDEFQDTDPRQWAIFRRLFADAPRDGATAGACIADGADADADADANADTDADADSDAVIDGGDLFGDPRDAADEGGPAPGVTRALLLIGDPKQAIYRFRGGDVDTYLAAQDEADARHPLLHNFRSRPVGLQATQALFTLRGDGAFAQAGIAFEPVLPGGACRDDMLQLDGRDAPALVVQSLAMDRQASADDVRAHATAACVARIHALLSQSQAGRARLVDRHGVARAVRPGDIAVLVNTNADAARMQRALSQAGIPAVAAGRCSLYQADEAQHLAWLLAALAAPADDGRLRAALATPLFGLDAGAIAAFDTDLDAHRAWQDALQHWLARARRHGPVALLGELCAREAPRLLGWPDGERRLGNYLQLAEELQASEAARHGPGALLAELERRIADADPANDAELLRLESDAARVRILTLHVSKGLTLDLVFMPYCASAAGGGKPTQPKMARVHDGLARVGVLFAESKDAACLQEAAELRAEQVRLLYVGLTRARLATWIGWGPGKDAHKTALGWLLHRGADGALPAPLDAAAVDAALQALRASAPDAIAIEAPVDPATLAALPRLRFDTGAAPPPARAIRRTLDRDWWVYSFSQLSREDSGAEERAADDELDTAPLATGGASPSRFSGPRFGNALHEALEHVDFAAWRDDRGEMPPPGQVEPLERALRHAGFASDADQLAGVPALSPLVAATLNARMPEGARLCDLPPAHRLAEMEFHLALAPVQVDALLALLHAHGIIAARRNFGDRRRLEGLLTGRIDLVYEFAGRFHVLDYKSNLLPAYDAPALARAVQDSEYDLQYVLYTLALHRWLRFRLGAAYDPRTHLGGVRYVFSRGLDPDDPACPGVHAPTLDPALVEALDRLCAGAPA